MKRWLQLSEECIKYIAILLTKEECFTENRFKIVDEFFIQSIKCDNVSEKGKEELTKMYENFLEVHDFRGKKLGWINDVEEPNNKS